MKTIYARMTFTVPLPLAKECKLYIRNGERSKIIQQALKEAILKQKQWKAFHSIIKNSKHLPKTLPNSVESLKQDRQNH